MHISLLEDQCFMSNLVLQNTNCEVFLLMWSKSVLWIVLDFNFPKVRWESIFSPHSDEQKFLDLFSNDLLLTQINTRLYTCFYGNLKLRISYLFDRFFNFDSKVLNLRIIDRERLPITRIKKKMYNKMFFFKVEHITNDAADLVNVSINFCKDDCKSKTATQILLMAIEMINLILTIVVP